MKRLYAIIGMAGALLAPSLYASLITYGDTGTIIINTGALSYGDGGVFYASSASLGNFQTFCIEDNEYYRPGSQYNYTVNTGAVTGGASGQHAVDTYDPYAGKPMDNISIGTAWLFSQFHDGKLGINTPLLAGDLQAAIWYLEGETPLVPGNGADGTTFYNDAVAHLAPGYSSVFADSLGAYDVFALNIWNPNNSDGLNGYNPETVNGLRQDQLYDPVPEPATIIAGALLLLPFGASTLRILRRKGAA